MQDPHLADLAARSMALLGTGRQVPPFTAQDPDLDLPAAYRVAAEVRRLREARGERVVGRKVGFTNRLLWDEYGVRAPAWGWMYDSTVRDIPETFSLEGLPEPKIEPEIAFRLSRAPEPGMDPAALLGCVEWVAHGFEIVQSPHPGWVFAPPDTVIAWGLHAALLLGPRHPVGDPARWLDALSSFEVDLLLDGQPADHGVSTNVLGGPLRALAHMNDLLHHDRSGPPLAAGEIVTTGTLTRALPALPGQRWSTRLHGLDLPPLDLRLG